MALGGQLHAPTALPPGKRPGTHCIGGWVGPRVGLDGCGKILPPPGFDPRTVQPVARFQQCCTLINLSPTAENLSNWQCR